jgi:hypothetical protein
MTITIFSLLFSFGAAQAVDFKIQLRADPDVLEYNFNKQYLNMKINKLVVPQQTPPKWYEKVFIKRKDYGIAYFDYTFEDGSKIKQALFQYEKIDSSNYKYDYLVPTAAAPAYLLEQVLITRPFKMQLIVKNWEEGENTSLLKIFVKKLNLFSSASPDVVSSSFKLALQIGNAALDAIEEIFPAKSTEESGTITIDPDNLRKGYILKMLDSTGASNEFAVLSMSASESLFVETGGHLEATLSRYNDKFKGVADWQDIIRSADRDIESGDIGPIINALSTFNKHIITLDLTNTDKILLLAKAACRWAPLTMQKEHISVKKFARIAVEGAESVLNDYKTSALNNCKFAMADCYLPITCSAFAFYSKSSNRKLKNIAKQYIDGTFELSLTTGDSTEVTVNDYLKHFRMRGRSKWSDSGDKTNKTYTFDKFNVTVTYTKDDKYSGKVVSINFYEDKGKYYLAEILVKK